MAGMAISMAVVIAMSNHWAPPLLTGLVLAASAGFVLTRPEPPPKPGPTDDV